MDCGRIPHVEAFIAALDEGVLADQGTLQEGVLDSRSLVDDGVTNYRVFHHRLGGNGDLGSVD